MNTKSSDTKQGKLCDSGKLCDKEAMEKGCDGKPCGFLDTIPKNNKEPIENKMMVPFEVKEIDESHDDYYVVKGYAGIFNGIDSYNDRVMPGAYHETLKKNHDGLPAFVMHNSFGDLPVGLWKTMVEDQKGLSVEGILPKNDEFVRTRLIPQIKVGSINALSIGYKAEDYKYEGEVRILTKIALKEISFITKGYQADPGALITEVKKADGRTKEEIFFNAMVDVKRKGATQEIKTEIIEFYHEIGKSSPFEKDAVISIEELKNMSKSNRAYSIRELKLSSNASNFLAGLMEKSSKDEKQEPQKPEVDQKDSVESNDQLSSKLDEIIINLTK